MVSQIIYLAWLYCILSPANPKYHQMWDIEKIEIKPDSVIKYYILKDGNRISFYAFINGLITSPKFRLYYNSVLSECEFEGFFWEHFPISHRSIEKDYEFVLLKDDFLYQMKPEPSIFSAYFEVSKNVVDFLNLGKDARLIVPTPEGDPDHYVHLGVFTRNAPKDQIDDFWKRVGEIYSKSIRKEKRWLSTCGLGVYWLHVRIDSIPKYYKHQEYKVLWDEDVCEGFEFESINSSVSYTSHVYWS